MRQPSENAVKTVYIPGEESYVKTITTLAHTVQNQKETVLRPSERVSFEKDMAVVNDAIQKMRKEVRRNPKNESAKQVLYTSYQNKIDLLNSVSQREELVASLKD
jgi:ribosomal protein S15P/S13E